MPELPDRSYWWRGHATSARLRSMKCCDCAFQVRAGHLLPGYALRNRDLHRWPHWSLCSCNTSRPEIPGSDVQQENIDKDSSAPRIASNADTPVRRLDNGKPPLSGAAAKLVPSSTTRTVSRRRRLGELTRLKNLSCRRTDSRHTAASWQFCACLLFRSRNNITDARGLRNRMTGCEWKPEKASESQIAHER